MAYKTTKELISIEVAHVYLGQKLDLEQKKGIEIMKSLNYPMAKIQVLIDDFHAQGDNLSEIIKEISSMCSNPVDFYQESEFLSKAQELISSISKEHFYFKYKEDKRFYYIKVNEREVLVSIEQDGKKIPSCAFLSFCWLMYRSGDKDFLGQEKPSKIITILPKKYKNIEKQVVELVKYYHKEEVLSKLEYLFF